MDAGLAAVLGAAVGAAGTGSAAVIAALLARSQGLLQVHAEHQRSIREPRKATYVAFAEAWYKQHSLITEAWARLEVAARLRGTPAYEEIASAVERMLDQAEETRNEIRHLGSAVQIEGPLWVSLAALKSQVEQLEHLHLLQEGVTALRSGTSPDLRPLDAAGLKAAATYEDFLTAVSDSLGDPVGRRRR
ncbi:hypothetical protein [Streptomyces lavendulae]|uniref:hypothetical protein n=1 Tax=Streptomyces lavendulae TaxID=1914 RepID=UPI0033D8ED99